MLLQPKKIQYKKTSKLKRETIDLKTINTDIKVTIKKKFLNHITKNGEKQISEKTTTKTLKSAQKCQKKNHNKIIKLSIRSATPIFRIIKLTNKKRRKKSVKEIPAFLSDYPSRTSWSIKYLSKSSTAHTNSKNFFKRLEKEILLSAASESSAITLKNGIQNKALQEKKYFRKFRW